jgi:hypothetical protein
MNIILRICDKSQSKSNKFINFVNLYKRFNKFSTFYIFGDNIYNYTFEFLKSFNPFYIEQTSFGDIRGSFMNIYNFCIKNFTDDNTKFYFLEDDYIHTKNAPVILEEGFSIGDYVTVYDHPDKYINSKDGGNPFINNGGEDTKVLITKSSHWKYTNSTTLTFGTTLKILKKDYNIWNEIVYDFPTFCILNKYRKIVSSIPAQATHMDNTVFTTARFINWEDEL